MIENIFASADMGLRSGYKKTRFGWIPGDWSLPPLKDISLRKPEYGINAPAVSYSEELPTYLRITDIDESGRFKKSGKKSVRTGELDKYLLKPNDIVFARTGGTVGKTYLHTRNNGNLVFAGFLIRISPNPEFILPYYLKLFTESNKYWGWVKVYSMRSGQPGLNGEEIGNLRIPLPKIQEQQKIVEVISLWDSTINKLEKLIEQKELRKKGLMQQLLSGRKRLPGFSGEWKEQKFKKIAARINRKNTEGNDNVVTISAQRGFVRQEDFFRKRVASKTLLNYTLVQKGEYCYNKSYSQGYPMGAFKRLNDFDKAVVTTLYICFSLKDSVNSDFMNHYFEAGKMIPGLMRVAQEGGRAHGLLNIGLEDFFNLTIKLPLIEEQNAIAKVLNTAEQEINLLKEKLKKLKTQKKGLMQVLLTGKKRVTKLLQ